MKSTLASVISNSEPLSRPLGPALTPKERVAGAEHPLEAADHVVATGGRAAREQHGDALALDSVAGLPAAVRTTLLEAATLCGNCARTASLSLVLSTRSVFLKLTGCGLPDEPNAAQTGRGSWRTADSKIDLVRFCLDQLLDQGTHGLILGVQDM
jgi:hypothetical protein